MKSKYWLLLLLFPACAPSPKPPVTDPARAAIQTQLPFHLPDSLAIDSSPQGPRVFRADVNFDGIADVAVLGSVSNGCAICTMHVWLNQAGFWKYQPEIQHIGTPVLLPDRKILRGFDACCAYCEIHVTDYQWTGEGQLQKISRTSIENYALGPKEGRYTVWSPKGIRTRRYPLPAGLVDSLIAECRQQPW